MSSFLRKRTVRLALLEDPVVDAPKENIADVLSKPNEFDLLQKAEEISSKVLHDETYDKTLQVITDKAIASGAVDGSGISGGGGSSSSDSSSDDSSSDDGDGGGDDFGDFGDFGGGDGDSGDSDSDSGDSDGGDDADSDSSDDDPVKKPDSGDGGSDDKKDEDKKVDDKKSAQENLRVNVIDYSVIPYHSLALEIYDNTDISQYTDRKFHAVEPPINKLANWTGEKLAEFGSWLKQVGLKYGPVVLEKVATGLANLTKGLARAVISATELTRRYLNRHDSSFTKAEKEIHAMLERCEVAIQEKKNPTGAFTNAKKINLLKIGKSVDLKHNIVGMTNFTNSTLQGLSTLMKDDYKLMLQLMEMDSVSSVHDISSILALKTFDRVLASGNLPGYELRSDLLHSLVSKDIAMGDVKVCAHVPKHDLDSFDAYRKAYEQSTMFLGLNIEKAEGAGSIPFVKAYELKQILDHLLELCGQCKGHHKFYVETDKEISSFSTKWKVFLGNLVNSKKTFSIKETHMEIVYLRFGFIQRVYLPCAMDTHDYCLKVIQAVLEYSKQCMKSYK